MNQISSTILMVRPANFGYNPETANNNAFQINDTSLNKNEIQAKAVQEFDAFVAKLRAVGITILVVEDTTAPRKTDAIFPRGIKI